MVLVVRVESVNILDVPRSELQFFIFICFDAVKKKVEVDSIPTNKTAKSYEHRATSTRVINEEVFEDEEYIEEDIGVIQVCFCLLYVTWNAINRER